LNQKIYLGLGSNLGNRARNIEAALAEIERPGLHVLRRSRLYESEPVGFREQGWFLNMVAECETTLFPLQVLEHVKRVERKLGRIRTVPNGPRRIDIDILLWGNMTMRTGVLEIPHPRYRERRFALAPLAELSPFQRDPVTKETMFEMLQALRGQIVRPIEPGPAE